MQPSQNAQPNQINLRRGREEPAPSVSDPFFLRRVAPSTAFNTNSPATMQTNGSAEIPDSHSQGHAMRTGVEINDAFIANWAAENRASSSQYELGFDLAPKPSSSGYLAGLFSAFRNYAFCGHSTQPTVTEQQAKQSAENEQITEPTSTAKKEEARSLFDIFFDVGLSVFYRVGNYVRNTSLLKPTFDEVDVNMAIENPAMFYQALDTQLLTQEEITSMPLELLPIAYGFCQHKLAMLAYSMKGKARERLFKINELVIDLIKYGNADSYDKASLNCIEHLFFYKELLIAYSVFNRYLDSNFKPEPLKDNTPPPFPDTGFRAISNRFLSVFLGYKALLSDFINSRQDAGDTDDANNSDDTDNADSIDLSALPAFKVVVAYEKALKLLNEKLLNYENVRRFGIRYEVLQAPEVEEILNLITQSQEDKTAFIQRQIDLAMQAEAQPEEVERPESPLLVELDPADYEQRHNSSTDESESEGSDTESCNVYDSARSTTSSVYNTAESEDDDVEKDEETSTDKDNFYDYGISELQQMQEILRLLNIVEKRALEAQLDFGFITQSHLEKLITKQKTVLAWIYIGLSFGDSNKTAIERLAVRANRPTIKKSYRAMKTDAYEAVHPNNDNREQQGKRNNSSSDPLTNTTTIDI